MQANKASKQTTEELNRWLEKPTTSAGATLSAREDLKWLGSQNDLSSVHLNGNGNGNGNRGEKAESVKSDSGSKTGVASNGSGFAALFGCAGKRK